MKTTTRRKLSSSITEPKCCRKFSIIACACAVVSLLVHTYNFIESNEVKYDFEARNLVENILNERIEEKIDAYLMEISGSTSRRIKREAMLVCTDLEYLVQIVQRKLEVLLRYFKLKRKIILDILVRQNIIVFVRTKFSKYVSKSLRKEICTFYLVVFPNLNCFIENQSINKQKL